MFWTISSFLKFIVIFNRFSGHKVRTGHDVHTVLMDPAKERITGIIWLLTNAATAAHHGDEGEISYPHVGVELLLTVSSESMTRCSLDWKSKSKTSRSFAAPEKPSWMRTGGYREKDGDTRLMRDQKVFYMFFLLYIDIFSEPRALPANYSGTQRWSHLLIVLTANWFLNR